MNRRQFLTTVAAAPLLKLLPVPTVSPVTQDLDAAFRLMSTPSPMPISLPLARPDMGLWRTHHSRDNERLPPRARDRHQSRFVATPLTSTSGP